ncbi:MAG: hypothetical protein ACKV19_10715 [Verrucomicrobiales bacterium]
MDPDTGNDPQRQMPQSPDSRVKIQKNLVTGAQSFIIAPFWPGWNQTRSNTGAASMKKSLLLAAVLPLPVQAAVVEMWTFNDAPNEAVASGATD